MERLLLKKWDDSQQKEHVSKIEPECGTKEQTDTNQRGEGREIMGERRERVVKEHV